MQTKTKYTFISRLSFSSLAVLITTFIALPPVFAGTAQTQEVIVSIKPLYGLVQGVMGDTGKPSLLVSGKNSPHNFQLKPSQMQLMQQAKVIFYVDDYLEIFLSHAFTSLSANTKKVPLAQTAGLTLLPQRNNSNWQAHLHETEHMSHESEHMAYDLHLWLDPQNAIKMVATISDELSKLHPEHSNTYQNNADDMITKLKALDQELKTTLAPVQNKPFIVFHDAFQYFEQAYGLTAVGSITIEPGKSSSPQHIRRIRKQLIQTGALCVFHEPQFSARLADTVTEGIKVKYSMLDPLGADLPEETASYFSLLRNLAKNLVDCLQ